MLKINFYLDSDDDRLLPGLESYKKIWELEGEKITETIESISGLKFKEKLINSIIFRSVSHSHPLSLNADFVEERKKANLIHELCHRITVGRTTLFYPKMEPLEFTLNSHKAIDLILYDILTELYGEDYAKGQVELESTFRDTAKDAWDWALSFTKEERKSKFKEILLNE
ncbi:hypothetical protein KW795_02500 [Candidatus Microgenomates bacterium]|nr:hypothetical protein [Candidatus Microgenomates bacterium]